MIASATMLLFLLGCTQTHTYRVAIHNQTEGPITFGFTNDGAPHHQGWASPEELTDIPPSHRPQEWGQVVDPGHTAHAQAHGLFDPGAHAYLRIYTGTPNVDAMLAMSRGFGNRTDVIIQPDVINDCTVTNYDNRITARIIAH